MKSKDKELEYGNLVDEIRTLELNLGILTDSIDMFVISRSNVKEKLSNARDRLVKLNSKV